jgi:hypothetical protein
MNKGMNANFQSPVPWICTLLFTFLVGCTEGASERDRDSVSNAPLVTAPAPTQDAPAQRIRTDAGGIAATYIPHYENGSLVRITEERQTGSANHEGEYEFHGARLVRYKGAGLHDRGHVKLEFSVQGALIESRGTSGSATHDEVEAVRGRANLLRSHALAQRATQSHATN